MENLQTTTDFLTSPGELGEMIRKYDWSSTSLGPISQWPQSLKTTLSLMLNSNNAIWIGWGPENIFFYNDAYIEVLGIEKHKWALGKPTPVVWEEVWHSCGHMSDLVFNEGISSNVDDMQFFMRRGDFLEETFYSFSYSPVIDEEGKVGGLFCPNFETTSKILNARRSKTLSLLAENSLTAKNTNDAVALAAEALNKNAEDIPFALLYLINQNDKTAKAAKYIRTNETIETVFKSSVDIEDANNNNIVAEIIKKGKTQIVHINKLGISVKGQANQKVKEAIAVPFGLTGNNTAGLMICGINPTRKLDNEYQTFYEMAAVQISTALQNVTALENERRKAQELAELDKAKTAFFSNISHEFRTPLTLMLGPLEELLKNKDLNKKDKSTVETTHRNAVRLLRLVNTLLDFSLIESGRIKAKFVPTNIASLTKNLASNFRSITERAGLDLIVNVSTLSKITYVDREMWEKIVFNLLSNAFKYTLKGSISVLVTEEEDQAILTVKDSGVGIPENELTNIFNRFHRVQNSKGRSFEGTGIGLSMIKELIRHHGGEITVNSKIQEGTSFIVRIPFGKEHLPDNQVFEQAIDAETFLADAYSKEAEIMLEKEDIEVDAETVNKKQDVVLIVDDNADMRTHLKSIIEKQYKTITAINGEDALKKIKQYSPGIIISDVMMPVMDGIELLKAVKSNTDTSSIPVILLTARAGEESKIEGYETGADDYLVKPFSARELTARISSQLKIAKTREHARKQLQNLFIQAPVALSILKGKDFVVEIANENILEMWGQPASAIINKPLFEVLPEAAAQGYDKLLKNVYDTGIPYVDEEATFHKIENETKTTSYIKFIYQPYYEEDGEISGIMVLASDITPQVIARKKIEESENKFRNLIHQAYMPIVITKGEDFVFDFVNDAYLEIYNIKREQLLGKKIIEALPMLENTLVEKNLKKVFTTGQTHIFTEVPIEFNINGITQTRYFTSVYQPFIENGEISGVISIINEVTDQYLAKKIQQKNEEDLKTILEAMPQMAYRADAEGNPVFHSEKFYDYTGLNIEKAKNSMWSSIIHPDMYEDVRQQWELSLATGKEFEQAFQIKRISDQTYRWHLSRAVALRNEKGEITQWIGTLTDIHEQKVFAEKLEAMVNERTEELNASNKLLEEKNIQLENSNKELESFNYIASHDLQEPLRKIQTFISFIKDRNMSHEEAEPYIKKIHSSAGRMTQLIKDVLVYSRLSAEKDFVHVDLNEILDTVIADYELLIKEKKAKIERGWLPAIKGIPLQMEQLFSNLISNSLKYCEKTPVITISHEINPLTNSLHLIFKDNGIGFDAQYSDQIFKLFQRLHGKGDYAGTGIGLSICKKIVEQHNGSISAKSQPGQGATFNITLPLD